MAYVALGTVGTGSVLTSSGYNQLIANNVTGHPTLSTTARTALSLGAGDNGTMVYDTTLNQFYMWNGNSWIAAFWPTVNGSALAITGTAGITGLATAAGFSGSTAGFTGLATAGTLNINSGTAVNFRTSNQLLVNTIIPYSGNTLTVGSGQSYTTIFPGTLQAAISSSGTTNILGGTTTLTRMYADTTTAPTIGTVTGAGSITPTPRITGTDFRGTASFVAGASFTGTAVQITFNSAFTTTPAIHITPYTRPAGTVGLYVTPLGSTAFQIVTGNATTSGSTYSFSYMTFG